MPIGLTGRSKLSHLFWELADSGHEHDDPYVMAQAAIWGTARELQDAYGRVLAQFYQLKFELLNPV